MKKLKLSAVVTVAALTCATGANAQFSTLLKEAKKQLGASAQQPSATPGAPATPAAAARSAPQSQGANAKGELVLTKKRPTSFADAKANAAVEFNDGDDVWLAMHLTQPIKTYAATKFQAGAVQNYKIFFDLKRDGLETAFATCDWYLTPQEGESTDLILSLSPVSAREVPSGSFLVEAKTTCLFQAVADDGREPGRWNFRVGFLQVEGGMLRGDQAIVSAPLIANVPNGFPLWYKIYRNAGGACDPRTQAKGPAVILCKK